MIKLPIRLLILLALVASACGPDLDASPPVEREDDSAAVAGELPATNHYAIETPEGRMVVRLYDETPLHRDNFKRLVTSSFYDSTTFHRVISGFMIQGGDPNSKDEDPTNDGQGGPGHTVPAEFRPSLYHKRGALAAARLPDPINPDRESSGSQFYIVHGTPYDSTTLDMVQSQVRATTGDDSFRFSSEMRSEYGTAGGAPNLDQQYTVFGELVQGFEVLDRIAATPTPRTEGQAVPPNIGDRPLSRIWMIVQPIAPPAE